MASIKTILCILLLVYCPAIMAVTTYKIKVKNKITHIVYNFLAEIEREVEEKWAKIRVGSSRRYIPCVVLTLDLTGSISSELQDFEFDKRCADANDLLHGRDGTVTMLLTALEFMYQIFPSVVETEFSDKSVIQGVRYGGGSVSLADYYLLKSGKTWYETHFGAIPTTRLTKQILRESRHELARIVSLPSTTFLRRLGIQNDMKLVSLYEAVLHKQNWLTFELMASDIRTRVVLQEKLKRILDLLDISSLAANSWTLPKATIRTQMSQVCSIMSIVATDEKLGQRVGTVDKSSIRMHAGHNLGEGF